MSNDVLVAMLAFCGTLVGTIGGMVASAKLTTYRIQQLEKKVDKHNNFAERVPLIEKSVEELNEYLDDVKSIPVVKEQIKGITHRLDDLEQKIG